MPPVWLDVLAPAHDPQLAELLDHLSEHVGPLTHETANRRVMTFPLGVSQDEARAAVSDGLVAAGGQLGVDPAGYLKLGPRR